MHNTRLQGLKNTHILLIDDHPQDLDDLVNALRVQGARITSLISLEKGCITHKHSIPI